MSVEEALQNQYGSHLIDNLAVGGGGASGSLEVAMGFGRGEPLVPEVDGEREGLAEGAGKGAGEGGLGADVAGKMQRIADDDGGAAVFAEETAEGSEVLLRIFADQGEDGLGGEAEFVGDGDTDAAAAEIEAEEAGLHRNMLARTQRETGILEWVRESKKHNRHRTQDSLSCDVCFSFFSW